MPDYKYDYLIYIGRFQPYHSGHHHVALEALKVAKRLIFVIGSHDRPRDIRNPFLTHERIDIIKRMLGWKHQAVLDDNRIYFAPQVDYTYNDERWIAAVQSAVQAIVTQTYPGRWATGETPRIGLVGFDKDRSTYYLKKFPQWPVEHVTPINDYSATGLRKMLLSGHPTAITPGYLDYFVDGFHRGDVEKLVNSNPILRKEYDFVRVYREPIEEFEKKHWPIAFQTVDSVVTQSGHILLVKRKAMPGEGLWAMPGGFLKVKEGFTMLESALDELRDETQLKVPEAVLRGSIVKEKKYDDPHRSVRGRTVTQAYHFKLSDDFTLPKVKGGDDAAKAKWFTLNEFMGMRPVMFEDHFCIISDMLGI
jgi:bifunctional NMN adenylyltransferase/nudix hydrolase